MEVVVEAEEEEVVVVEVAEWIGELCGWDVRWRGVGQGEEDGDGALCDGKLTWVGMVFCLEIPPVVYEFGEEVAASSRMIVVAEVTWTISLFPSLYLFLDLSRDLDLCPSRLLPGVY